MQDRARGVGTLKIQERGHHRRLTARSVAIGVVLALFSLALGACVPPPPPPPPIVVVYGDSILDESQRFIAEGLAPSGWELLIRQGSGTGLCDWMPTMASADTSTRIHLVVVMHTGNWGNSVPWCDNSDWTLRYTKASDWVANLWQIRGVPVLWAAPAANIGAPGDDPLRAIYASTAASHGQQFVDAGASLRDVDGSWPYTLPCLPSELGMPECLPPPPPATTSTTTSTVAPTTSTTLLGSSGDPRIPVRKSMTNSHLCPVDAQPGWGGCPVYASGIVRFGGAIVSAARALMG